MNFRTAALFCFLVVFASRLNGQACTTLGQTPATAFPVCGTSSFSQNTVPICGNTPVPGVGCANVLSDKNPYWYKFTCFEAGKLAFQITPNDLGDDYDWQIYDITGKNPNEVYSNSSIIVASNWSGEPGITGASVAGRSLNVCEGFGRPLFSAMPDLVKGHEYIMLVSHFTNSQSGYKLSFGGSGSTASITDTKPPAIEKVIAACDGSRLTVVLNKQMRCASLAANGSDFQLIGGSAVQSATAGSCTGGFDMDTVIVTLTAPLIPGSYKLRMTKGVDGNSLTDNCGTPVPDGDIPFVVTPVQPTLLDSLIPLKCAPSELTLVFNTAMRCPSVATNGSDFIITGPSAVQVTGATADCNGQGLAGKITLKLAGPIFTGGTYQVSVVNGTDLNTIINECGVATPAGSSISFQLKDTVSAVFTYDITLGCRIDTVSYFHDGRNGINTYQWLMDDNKTSRAQHPVAYYTKFGQKQVSLTVSNGFCSDTSSQNLLLDNELSAKFSYPAIVCPEEPAIFSDGSAGKIISWNWQFGNGFSSTSQNPGPQPYILPPLTRERKFNVKLIIGNELGCFDTTTVTIKAVSSCYIAVPGAFTPNNDGVNDFLYPLNAFKALNLQFRVFNRYGQQVFQAKEPDQKWDGTIRGTPQPAGTYVWTLSYTESDTGKQVSVKGSSVLVR
jgi:gliding motility-associated-like protein